MYLLQKTITTAKKEAEIMLTMCENWKMNIGPVLFYFFFFFAVEWRNCVVKKSEERGIKMMTVMTTMLKVLMLFIRWNSITSITYLVLTCFDVVCAWVDGISG